MPRAGRQPRSAYRTPRLPRSREIYAPGVVGEEVSVPAPESLGVGSADEAKVFIILKRHGINFQIQWNFDGGSDVWGGQRADFVIPDRRLIIEVVGFWHDMPDQRIRDERKWERRRQEGWTVTQIKPASYAAMEADILIALGRPVV